MQKTMIKTQISLPKSTDKVLKRIKLELELKNKSEAVEFLINALTRKLKPEIEAKFEKAMKTSHRKLSAKRAKTLEEMNKEMESW